MTKRSALRIALLAALAAAAGVAGSCARSKKGPTLYLPAGATNIAINLDFPLSAVSGTKQDFAYVCEDAKSLLISVDVDSGANIGWDYRFLVGLDGKIWGCADSSLPCVVQKIQTDLSKPARIAVEGIDVDPQDYPSAATHNVVCRGVADVTVGMGTILAESSPTPTPQPSPPPSLVNLTITATVPMLRVGDVNGTYTTAGPYGAYQTSAVMPSATRAANGGEVIISGGHGPNMVFVFRPWSIGSYPDAASYGSQRTLAFSTGFLDSAGRPSIIVAGGYKLNQALVNTIDVLRPGMVGSTTFAPYGGYLLTNATPIWLPDHREGGVASPAVLFVGGCDATATTLFNPRYSYFFPSAPIDLTNCSGGATPQDPAVCAPGLGDMMGDGGHCVMPVGIFTTPTGPKVFVGMGYMAGAVASTHAYVFDPETKTYSGPVSVEGVPPVAGYGSVSLSPSLLAIFGGFDSSGNPTDHWGFFRTSNNAFVQGAGNLSTKRADHSQVGLLDGRVLLAGGGPPDNQTIEEFVPNASVTTSGSFTFLNRSRNCGSCTAGTSPNCVRLKVARVQETSALIRGSKTWLNGSVVIAGGTGVTMQHATELFVPAYNCDGATPISVSGAHLADVDFCDVGRSGVSITHPDTATPF